MHFLLSKILLKFLNTNKIWNLFVGIFIPSIICSQINNLNFENLTSKDGLSQNSVIKIFQDSRNFLWFGTYDGVNRYDGYNFRIYKSVIDDSTTLSGININSICKDKYGNLWFASLGGGLCKYDRNTETFKRYIYNENFSNSLCSNYIRDLLFDDYGDLWIATEQGLDKFNTKTEKFTHFSYDSSNSNSLGSNYLLCLGKDNYGNI